MIMIFDDCSGNPRPRVTWSKVNQADIVGEGEALELREVGRQQCHLPHRHDDEPDDDPDHAHDNHHDRRCPGTKRGSTSAALAMVLEKGRLARSTWGFYVSAILIILRQ